MEFISEPKNDAYRDLVDLAFDLCDEFILVVCNELRLNDNAKSILDRLKPYLTEIKEQSEWAGTELLDTTALVYHYRTDAQAREIIKEVSDSLYCWLPPNLPEDLSFYKNGEPWLVNISHEKTSYIRTNEKSEKDMIMSIKGLEIYAD